MLRAKCASLASPLSVMRSHSIGQLNGQALGAGELLGVRRVLDAVGVRVGLDRVDDHVEVTGLPRFVTTRGGVYLFLPSMTALRRLAA